MGSEYYNRTSSGISVTLCDGSSGYVRSKGTLTVTEDQDNSADLVAKVRKKQLVRRNRVVVVASETPTEPVQVVPATEPEEVQIVAPEPQQAKVVEEPVAEKEEDSSVAVDPLSDFLDNQADESPQKNISRRRGGKRQSKRS